VGRGVSETDTGKTKRPVYWLCVPFLKQNVTEVFSETDIGKTKRQLLYILHFVIIACSLVKKNTTSTPNTQ